MPLTPNWGIYYADQGTPMSAEAISAAEATSIEEALDSALGADRAIHSYRWADATARGAQTGMSAWDTGVQEDTGIGYTYIGSAWVPTFNLPAVWAASTPAGTGTSVTSTGSGAGTVLNSYNSIVYRNWGSTMASGILTVPVSGVYFVTAYASLSGDGGTINWLRLNSSNSGVPIDAYGDRQNSNRHRSFSASASFSAGDTVWLTDRQNSGSTLTSNPYSLTMEMIGT